MVRHFGEKTLIFKFINIKQLLSNDEIITKEAD